MEEVSTFFRFGAEHLYGAGHVVRAERDARCGAWWVVRFVFMLLCDVLPMCTLMVPIVHASIIMVPLP